MIERAVKKGTLREMSEPSRDRAYWMQRSPEERISAVEILRRQMYGDPPRLQRVVRVLDRREG
jgi:hypothetical protein